jgi:outer membrane protein OmpA-like peptidoglycan-associated protein
VAVVVVATSAAAANAAARQGEPDEPRARDLVYRVRDLNYQWRALDDSERVKETAETTTVTFAADVFFEFDRADLTSQAQTRLGELADQLSAPGGRPVTIVGHSDSHGDDAYNDDLSLRRARAVEAALAAELGGDFTFDVSGRGESEPVAPNEHEDGSDNPEGRALNRRVEISFPTG